MMERSHLEAEDLIRGVVSDQGLKVDIGYGDVLDHAQTMSTPLCHLGSAQDLERGATSCAWLSTASV